MSQYLENVLHGGRFTLGLAELLCKGITPEIAARKPRGEGGRTIDTNHAAFVFGHLSIYPARALDRFGIKSPNVVTPAGWEDLFKPGVECRDDAAGSIYPAWPELQRQFFTLTRSAVEVLATIDEKRLLEPTPDPKARERFPTLGSLVGFYLLGHAMMHLGQVSAWRRCFGLPSAM